MRFIRGRPKSFLNYGSEVVGNDVLKYLMIESLRTRNKRNCISLKEDEENCDEIYMKMCDEGSIIQVTIVSLTFI